MRLFSLGFCFEQNLQKVKWCQGNHIKAEEHRYFTNSIFPTIFSCQKTPGLQEHAALVWLKKSRVYVYDKLVLLLLRVRAAPWGLNGNPPLLFSCSFLLLLMRTNHYISPQPFSKVNHFVIKSLIRNTQPIWTWNKLSRSNVRWVWTTTTIIFGLW